MVSSAATSGLPASRSEAISVVVLGLVSAFFGATPGDEKAVSMGLSVLANLWAVVSSAITLWEVHNQLDAIEIHLWILLMGLLGLTFITSVIALILLLSDNERSVLKCLFLGGVLVVFVTFVLGLVALLLAYTTGCEDESFQKATALCQHTEVHVIGVIAGAATIGTIGAGIIAFYSDEGSGPVVYSVWTRMSDDVQDDDPRSTNGAILTRISALVKACLLGVYWFLVDDAMSWHGEANGMSWWVTGQWAKQGSAILNNFFNCIC